VNSDLAVQFYREASRVFAFVSREYGFSAARLAIDDTINFAFVTLIGTHLAIECILDERENDVTCKISRVVDGAITPYYGVDDTGSRVREGLASLVRRRGVNEQLFRSVRGLSSEERMRVTLEDFAAMLRKHAQDVLADSTAALD
jgi:hypothetical protein